MQKAAEQAEQSKKRKTTHSSGQQQNGAAATSAAAVLAQPDYEEYEHEPGTHLPHDAHRPKVKNRIVDLYDLKNGTKIIDAILEKDESLQGPSGAFARQEIQGVVHRLNNQVQQFNDSWPDEKLTLTEQRLKELVEFKLKNGHTNVSSKAGKLGSWLASQRKNYRKMQQGHITDGIHKARIGNNIECLNRLNFQWEAPNAVEYRTWEENYKRLQAFVQEHGHARVPIVYKPDRKLGHWVSNERQKYNLLKEGKKAPLTKEQIQKFEEVGMDWKLRRQGARLTWDEGYKRLKAFVQQHGHARVSQGDDDKDLGAWVSNQRRSYTRRNQDKYSSITDEQIQKLNDVGFEWRLRPFHGSKRSWDESFEILRKFIQEHGHARVPKVYVADVSLGNWVAKQRLCYGKFLQGKDASPLNEERVAKMNEVGFEWRIRKERTEENHNMNLHQEEPYYGSSQYH